MELANWRPLADRGADLIPCLDFPGGRAAAGFEELAAAIEASARHLTPAELDGARLGVSGTFRAELTATFTAYMDYLLLASQGGFDTHAAAPVYLTSHGYQPPVETTRAITVDTDHDEPLRAPQAHALITDLLSGEHPWCPRPT